MISEKTKVQEVDIDKLVLDKAVQMRDSISVSAVQDYADAMEEGAEFPPIIVFYRFGGKYYVADGFHRVMAARKAKRETIRAEIRDGSRRDAVLYAAGANATHGVRRTNADKHRAVAALLNDREWVKWVDAEIARRCGVGRGLVAKIREDMGKERDVKLYIHPRSGKVAELILPREERSDEGDLDTSCPRKKCPYCGQLMPRGKR